MKKVKVRATYKCLTCDKFVFVENALPVGAAKSAVSDAVLETGDDCRARFPNRVLHFCRTQRFGPHYAGSAAELFSDDCKENEAGIAVICGFSVGRVFEE